MPLLLQLAATDIISGQGKEACAARLEIGGFKPTTTLFKVFFFEGMCSRRKTRGAFFFIFIKARDGAYVDDASTF
jgi:hypothetical protein